MNSGREFHEECEELRSGEPEGSGDLDKSVAPASVLLDC